MLLLQFEQNNVNFNAHCNLSYLAELLTLLFSGVTKTEFLLKISIQYQAHLGCEWLLDPMPVSPN